MITFTIFGEPASKANSRKVATVGAANNRRMLFIKSGKARNYETDALIQIPPWARQRLEGPVRVTLRIWYATQRPDLDESIVLDVLQDRWRKAKRDREGNEVSPAQIVQPGVYRNDRQVREKHVFHGIDRTNPRTEVTIEPLQAQQRDLIGEAA